MPASFSALAQQLDIALPPLLAHWQREGLAGPGDDALTCLPDLEWLDADTAQALVAEWLHPAAQHGHRFLPFAQTGAGDAYSLVRLADGREGVACVLHDDPHSELAHEHFEAFVAGALTDTLANLEEWFANSDAPPSQALAQLAEAIDRACAPMAPPWAGRLREQSRQPLLQVEWRSGPKARPQQVPALLEPEQAQAQQAALRSPDATRFAVVASWDIDGA